MPSTAALAENNKALGNRFVRDFWIGRNLAHESVSDNQDL
jgi:hypothetical protein